MLIELVILSKPVLFMFGFGDAELEMQGSRSRNIARIFSMLQVIILEIVGSSLCQDCSVFDSISNFIIDVEALY